MSQPVGKDLLSLISKRTQGIGVSGAGLRCTIMFGQGTLTNRHGNLTQGRYIGTASGRTFAGPDIDLSLDEDLLELMMAKRYRRTGKSAGHSFQMAGQGIPAFVSFNPFINYDVAAFVDVVAMAPGEGRSASSGCVLTVST